MSSTNQRTTMATLANEWTHYMFPNIYCGQYVHVGFCQRTPRYPDIPDIYIFTFSQITLLKVLDIPPSLEVQKL